VCMQHRIRLRTIFWNKSVDLQPSRSIQHRSTEYQIVKIACVGSEVLATVVMKSTVFWDATPFTLSKSQPTFRRNISPPSSGSNKTSKMSAWKQVASRVILLTKCWITWDVVLTVQQFIMRGGIVHQMLCKNAILLMKRKFQCLE
jgi:hypothetical protein